MVRQCKSHPRYKAKREPNSVCGDCWLLWYLKHPKVKQPPQVDLQSPVQDFASLDVVVQKGES